MSSLDSLRKKKPAPLAKSTAATPAQSTGVKPGTYMVVGYILGILTMLVIGGGLPDWKFSFGGDRDEQHHEHKHEQVEPVKGGMLVFVCDKKLPTVEQDLLMRSMPEFTKTHSVEFLWLDDEDPAIKSLKSFAEGKSITPPLVGYVKDKQVKRVAAWPADQQALEAFLK